MRKIFLVLLAVVLVSFGAGFSFAADNSSSVKVVAYYFHGNFRCATCHKLEQYSQEAIVANFQKELESGQLVFIPVNTDERGNEHFVKDYQLYTKSLVLSLVKDGKEIKFQNLPKVWEYVGDKQKFFDYVKEEVANYLKEF